MELLYCDDDLAVCVKPVGVSSEDAAGGMPELLRQMLGGEIFPVHRLDMNVGGVMLYARRKSAAAAVSKMIQDGLLIKEYLAVLSGCPAAPCGLLEDLLWKDSRKNKVFVVKSQRKGVKPGKLVYKTLQLGTRSLVRVRLFTGRSHQIRVQFASRGVPLVGDHKYGSRSEEKSPALWSYRLTLPHPTHGKQLCFSKLPAGGVWEEFQKVMPTGEECETYGV